MKHKICNTKNVARLAQAGDSLINRTPGMPGMGLISGPTRYGKSTASYWYATQCDGIFVRAMAFWSPSAMLAAILWELGVKMKGSNAQLASAIIELLAKYNRALFIDEADYLLRHSLMVETLRDLHDMTNVPVILIGEEGMKKKLTGYKRLTGRLAEHVEFTAADMADARSLADGLCETGVADDLLERLLKQSGGSTGLIVIGLGKIEQLARTKNLGSVRLKDWPSKRSFFEGEPPAPPPAKVVSINEAG